MAAENDKYMRMLPVVEIPGQLVEHGYDPRVERMMSGLTTESKVVILWSLRAGECSSWELQKRLIQRQGGVEAAEAYGWLMSQRNAAYGCDNSLIPAGLVSVSSVGRGNVYELTEEGKGRGLALAGMLLSLAGDTGMSLRDMLGGTQSRVAKRVVCGDGEHVLKITSPGIWYRLMLVMQMVESGSGVTDIAKMVGENEVVVGHHLEQLAGMGWVDYEAAPGSGSYAFYRLDGHGEVENLTAEEVEILEVVNGLGEGWLAIVEVYEAMGGVGEARRVAGVLRSLANKGYLESGPFSAKNQSRITMNEQQRSRLVAMGEWVRRISVGDENVVDEGRRLLEEQLSGPAGVARVLRQARERSIVVTALSFEEKQQIVVELLGSSEGGMTVDDIGLRLALLGYDYSLVTIRELVKRMGGGAMVELVGKSRGKNVWRLVKRKR